MNKKTMPTTLLVVAFLYQVSFLTIYLTDKLVTFNTKLADTYWVSAGLVGVIISGYMMTKVKMGPLNNLLAFVVLIIGIGLLGLLFLALGITSM